MPVCFLYLWFIADCWLFQQKPVIEMIKLNFFEFSFYLFSLLRLFLWCCNSLGFLNFGFRVLLLCMQSLLCWHCFTILVFSNFSMSCTTDDHLYAAYYPSFWNHVQQLMIIFTVVIIHNEGCIAVSRMTAPLNHICNYSFVESEQIHLNGNLYL